MGKTVFGRKWLLTIDNFVFAWDVGMCKGDSQAYSVLVEGVVFLEQRRTDALAKELFKLQSFFKTLSTLNQIQGLPLVI